MFVDALMLIAVGLVSGYASGLFGIGGGLLRIPIFLHLLPVLGVPTALLMHVSAGTSLAVAVPTSLSASRSQHKAGNVDTDLLWTWLPPMVIGVVVGIIATRFLPGRVLEGLFVVAVLIAAARMIVPRAKSATAASHNPNAGLPSRPILALLSAGIGILSPMVGIVGGTFSTPMLTAFRYPIHRAVGISCVGGLVVSVLGTIGFIVTGWDTVGLPSRFIGYVDPLALAVMTPCVLATVPLGVRTANRLSPRTLELLFGMMLIVIAADVGWHVLTKSG